MTIVQRRISGGRTTELHNAFRPAGLEILAKPGGEPIRNPELGGRLPAHGWEVPLPTLALRDDAPCLVVTPLAMGDQHYNHGKDHRDKARYPNDKSPSLHGRFTSN